MAVSCMLAGSVAFAGPENVATDTSSSPAAQSESFWTRETLTGDWGGTRTALADHGVEIGLEYTGETLGVLSGGLERGTTYEGRADLSLDVDLDKLTGWQGATFHATFFNIHDSGRNAAENAGAIADPSNIDAYSTSRLFTAWLEQRFFDDRFSVRLGQLAADDEFLTSDTAGDLINGTFGWAGLLAANITNGGPAYPLATPGIRLQFKPSQDITLLAGAFSGDPAGQDCNGDAQKCNRYGTRFPIHKEKLFIGELQYGVNQSESSAGLPGVYKLGVWAANGNYADQRYGLNSAGASVPLADPSADGPRNHDGNWGVYGVVDQTVWRGRRSSVSAFLRGGFSPSDRNLISYYVDGGIGWKGPLASRPEDVLTLGVAYARISNRAINADKDALRIQGSPYAVRDHEMVFELSYIAQLTPWWTIQPDIQYIVHPNGGQSPDDATQGLGHAFIAGLRTTIVF